MNKKTLCTFIVINTLISSLNAMVSDCFNEPSTAPHSPALIPMTFNTETAFKEPPSNSNSPALELKTVDSGTVFKEPATTPSSPVLEAQGVQQTASTGKILMPSAEDDIQSTTELAIFFVEPALSLGKGRGSLTSSPQSIESTPLASNLNKDRDCNTPTLLEEMAKRFKPLGFYPIITKPTKNRKK